MWAAVYVMLRKSQGHSTYSIRCPVVLVRRPDRKQPGTQTANAFKAVLLPVLYIVLSRQLSRAMK